MRRCNANSVPNLLSSDSAKMIFVRLPKCHLPICLKKSYLCHSFFNAQPRSKPTSPMSRKLPVAILFAILFLWQLPQNLVALAVLPFIGKLRVVARRNYCIGVAGSRFPDNASGVSLGNFAIFHPDSIRDDFTIRHEMDGHAVDSMIFGPLYLFIIGIPSVLHLLFMKKGGDYYDFWTERRANRFARITPPSHRSRK